MKHKSQTVSYWYFLVALVLFFLQIGFGLWIAAQYIWPKLTWMQFPFNIGREFHINLLIFWLVIGLMGIVYYILPQETGNEIASPRLAYAQLMLLTLTGVAVLTGFVFRYTEGREYLEAPRYADWLIVGAALIFVYNTVATILKRTKPITATLGIIVGGMAGLATIYLAGMFFAPNLAIDEFFRWWVVHLWVEGAWELIAAGIVGFMLMQLTGVDRAIVEKWMYVEVALVLVTGIIGTGHHYFWIGTPSGWLWWGGIFGALEPIPILMMVLDARKYMRMRTLTYPNKVASTWTYGSVYTHFVGAGVWGFILTTPWVNRWLHGTQFTAAHGHFAFFGAYAMMVLAFIYLVMPLMTRRLDFKTWRGNGAFWIMLGSLIIMVLILSGAGLVQMYYARMLGVPFIRVRNQYLSTWLTWRFIIGWVFAAGLTLIVWDFFAFGLPMREQEKTEDFSTRLSTSLEARSKNK